VPFSAGPTTAERSGTTETAPEDAPLDEQLDERRSKSLGVDHWLTGIRATIVFWAAVLGCLLLMLLGSVVTGVVSYLVLVNAILLIRPRTNRWLAKGLFVVQISVVSMVVVPIGGLSPATAGRFCLATQRG
jgi:hypothetical protein